MAEQIRLEDVLNNISADEFTLASKWLNHLRDVEQQNVLATLKSVHDFQSNANREHPNKPIGWSLVVAGSSVTSDNYEDIHLFMIPETYENGGLIQKIKFTRGVAIQLEEFNCLFRGESAYKKGETLGMDPAEHGQPLTMYFMHDKPDFELQRKEGDVLYKPTLDSEHIIELNKRRKTNMRVLSRNYVFGKDYSSIKDSDLEVHPEKIIELYGSQIDKGMRIEIDKIFTEISYLAAQSSGNVKDLRGMCLKMLTVANLFVSHDKDALEEKYIRCLINYRIQ